MTEIIQKGQSRKRAETIEEAIAAEIALANDLGDYVGKWVAVADHKVVAADISLDALLKEVGIRRPQTKAERRRQSGDVTEVDSVFKVLPDVPLIL